MPTEEPTELQQLDDAIWVVDDWLDMMSDLDDTNDPQWTARIATTKNTLAWLKTKRSAFESRVAITPEKGAAEILASMLSTWQLPGAIWYRSATKRWRLCGVDYQETAGEFCLGVFRPSASADEIAAEIAAFERELHEPAPKAPRAQKSTPLAVASTKHTKRMADLKPSVVHTLKG
jgi:hypothetical protein